MTPTALVVRNYHCRASARFAYWLQERFDTPRYCHVAIDPNEGFPEAGDQWYAAYKDLTARGTYIIAIVTTALSDAPDEEDKSFKGVALLSELLHFWDGGMRDDERPNPALLIPVVLDCDLDALRRPEGKHEQLQDIAVPLLKGAGPIYVDTDKLYGSGGEMYAVADAIATRMGVTIDHTKK